MERYNLTTGGRNSSLRPRIESRKTVKVTVHYVKLLLTFGHGIVSVEVTVVGVRVDMADVTHGERTYLVDFFSAVV